MFERFTDRARRVVLSGQEEARRLDHSYLGPEHLLLGLIREGSGLAIRALRGLGIEPDRVREGVEERVGRGQASPSGRIPFTPGAKQALELALAEARHLGHNYVGTEHILLGLIRGGDDVAAPVLAGLGADLSRVRLEVNALLAAYQQGKADGQGGTGGAA
jgi:ATP-dependent Clp protease ATP-binding subunit ClpC